MATACIDNEYDLQKIDTDNVAIGDETSVFEVPLAQVSVSMKEISSSSDIRIDNLFDEADIWLPTQLPDQDEEGQAYVKVQELLHNPDYVNNELLPRLIEQMTSDSEKLEAVTDLLQKKYYDDFAGLLPGVTPETFKTAFKTAFTSNETLREQLADEVRNVANSYLTTLDVDLKDLSYDIEHIDISDDIIDMLANNLDPADAPTQKNTLHLAGTIDNRLPITLQVSPTFTPTSITFETTTIAANHEGNELPETQLYAEDLRTITRGITILIPVVIERYYPGQGFGSAEDSTPQITINLHLIKRGALKFDL